MTSDLILGVDGGGTSTAAAIAAADDLHNILGRGTAGPSNPQTVGPEAAIEQINQAIESAFSAAGLPPREFASACIGLAGADRVADQAALHEWSDRRQLTGRLLVVNDALPVLYAANPDGCGIALISGTGSFCFGRTRDGETARAGGWGPLFGDEGSAYRIALDGLRAAATSADGRGPATGLTESFLAALKRSSAVDLISAIYDPAMTRARIAALSHVVFDAQSTGDVVAEEILAEAARGLVDQVAAVADRLGFTPGPFALALTGGVLLHRTEFRNRLKTVLEHRGMTAEPIVSVVDPVAGALRIAGQTASCR